MLHHLYEAFLFFHKSDMAIKVYENKPLKCQILYENEMREILYR